MLLLGLSRLKTRFTEVFEFLFLSIDLWIILHRMRSLSIFTILLIAVTIAQGMSVRPPP